MDFPSILSRSVLDFVSYFVVFVRECCRISMWVLVYFLRGFYGVLSGMSLETDKPTRPYVRVSCICVCFCVYILKRRHG